MSDLFTATTAAEVEECLARGDNLEEEEKGGLWEGREGGEDQDHQGFLDSCSVCLFD